MRILVASNLYPPNHIGGYELRVKDIVDGLCEKGHDVYVLTSRYGVGKKIIEGKIFRWLDVFIYEYTSLPKEGIIKQFLRARREIKLIKRLIRSLRIDLIYMAKVQGFHEAIIAQLANLGIPVVWDFSDQWLTTFSNESWFTFWRRYPDHKIYYFPKLLMRKLLSFSVPTEIPELHFENACYTSHYLKQYYGGIGLPLSKSEVIHCGCPEYFLTQIREETNQREFRYLYSGQFVEGKGVHTIIEAVCELKNRNPLIDFHLDIVGEGIPLYVEQLKKRVYETGMSDTVTFLPKLPRGKMRELYMQYDALIFPSIWDEALALTLLEAMAIGLPVISTATGGNSELLIHEQNSLVFVPEDYLELSKHMERIIVDKEIRRKISTNGREIVRRKFTVAGMIDAVEKYLHKVINNPEDYAGKITGTISEICTVGQNS